MIYCSNNLNAQIFTILFKFLDFLGSLDRFKVLIKVIISDFYTARRKNFTKTLTSRRGDVCPHVQTVSTSLMSRLVKNSPQLNSENYLVKNFFKLFRKMWLLKKSNWDSDVGIFLVMGSEWEFRATVKIKRAHTNSNLKNFLNKGHWSISFSPNAVGINYQNFEIFD